MLAQQLLLYGDCQWVQIIALNLNFPLKFIRIISSCWIKHEKESKKIGRARSIYSWSRDKTLQDVIQASDRGKLLSNGKGMAFSQNTYGLIFFRACLCETSMDESWTEENRVGKALSNRKKHSQQKTTELTALSLCDNECPQLDTQSVGEQRLFSSSYWQFD